MYSQSLDTYIAPLISLSNSGMNLYKEYGVVTDGVCEINKLLWSYWTELRLKPKKNSIGTFLTISILFQWKINP